MHVRCCCCCCVDCDVIIIERRANYLRICVYTQIRIMMEKRNLLTAQLIVGRDAGKQFRAPGTNSELNAIIQLKWSLYMGIARAISRVLRVKLFKFNSGCNMSEILSGIQQLTLWINKFVKWSPSDRAIVRCSTNEKGPRVVFCAYKDLSALWWKLMG